MLIHFVWVFLIQQNFVSLFWTFIYKIDGFQFEHVSSLNKKHGISFFVIMWIDFAWILVLYLLGKALNKFQSVVLIYHTKCLTIFSWSPKFFHTGFQNYCVFSSNMYRLCLIHDQRMARTWMIMTILNNYWWKYVFYVLVEICFGAYLFWWNMFPQFQIFFIFRMFRIFPLFEGNIMFWGVIN